MPTSTHFAKLNKLALSRGIQQVAHLFNPASTEVLGPRRTIVFLGGKSGQQKINCAKCFATREHSVLTQGLGRLDSLPALYCW